jgi:hypothetical protein
LEQGLKNILAEEETHWSQEEPLFNANGQLLEEGSTNILAQEETHLPQEEPHLPQEEPHLPQEEPPSSADGQLKARGRPVQSYSGLGKFIITTLNDGHEWSLDDLTRLSIKAGVLVGKTDPRKVMQMVLEGMKQNGVVEMTASRKWRLAQNVMEST